MLRREAQARQRAALLLTLYEGCTHNPSPAGQSIKGDAMRFMSGFVGLITVLALVAGCTNSAPPAETKTAVAPTAAPPAQSPVERGKYLTLVGGCNDCHTPKKIGPNGPEADMSRELSGNPSMDKLPPVPKGVIGPWGTVANNH